MPANPSVDLAFQQEFGAGVHVAYQRQGSKLRNTVRQKNNVKGESTTFQKVGKGTASQKGRHGDIPPMNLDHSPVKCDLTDWYAGDYVDDLDALKLDSAVDELQVAQNAGAYALGRETDAAIIAEMDTVTNYAGTGADGLTKAKVQTALAMLGDADVPDDGQRFAIVGWKQWNDLLNIQEFANADYVGDTDLPWKGSQAKNWLGTLWMPHSGLTKDGSDIRYCYWYHKTAIGHACGKDITTDVQWIAPKAANWVGHRMSMGAKLIDNTGIVSMRCLES